MASIPFLSPFFSIKFQQVLDIPRDQTPILPTLIKFGTITRKRGRTVVIRASFNAAQPVIRLTGTRGSLSSGGQCSLVLIIKNTRVVDTI